MFTIELTTAKGISILLGQSMSTVYRLLKSGKIQNMKYGGLYYISLRSFAEYLGCSYNELLNWEAYTKIETTTLYVGMVERNWHHVLACDMYDPPWSGNF